MSWLRQDFPHTRNTDSDLTQIIQMYYMLRDLPRQWEDYKGIINGEWDSYQNTMNKNFQELHDYVMNYFDTLDVQEEINNKINQMVQDGSLIRILTPLVTPLLVEETDKWLGAHITNPANPPLDTSLLLENAAANSKQTGNQISALKSINNSVHIYDNLLNIANVQRGYYYANPYLNKVTNDGYAVYPQITLTPGYTYTIQDVAENFTYIKLDNASPAVIITDERFNYIQKSGMMATFTCPMNATVQLYLTTHITNVDKHVMTTGDNLYKDFIAYGNTIVEIPNLIYDDKLQFNTSLYVRPTATPSDTTFTTITEAVSRANTIATKNNIVNVYITSGTYDLFTELGGQTFVDTVLSSTSERQGLFVNDYVNLIGMGSVTLNMTPENVPADFTRKVSTLNFWKHNKIINIKAYAKNCRYVCHIETNNSYEDSSIYVENCYFEHLGASVTGAWTSRQAVACGTGKYGLYVFKNSYMKSDVSQGFSMHTNANQIGNNLTIDGCVLVGGGTNVGGYVSTYGSGSLKVNNVYLKNSIVQPKQFSISKDPTYENVWNFYDFINMTFTPT